MTLSSASELLVLFTDPWALLIFTHVVLIRLQYLEIEVKNPRTHIENEKAQYTDYEIELKVRSHTCFVVKGQVFKVS